MEKEETLPDLFYEVNMLLIFMLDNYALGKENYRPMFSTSADANIINKIHKTEYITIMLRLFWEFIFIIFYYIPYIQRWDMYAPNYMNNTNLEALIDISKKLKQPNAINKRRDE